MPGAVPTFIGVAWPYANGPLHLGHVAGSLLPPDIFRRYKRMAGDDVLMVSGSDCHGTPIMLKAEGEGVDPSVVVDRYHEEHVRALERLDIGFDCFTKTTTPNHREHVQDIFRSLLAAGFIEKRTQKAPFDPVAGRFLPDRYVEGTCPHCEAGGARGDQCDACGKTLDPVELVDPRSKLNPDAAIEFKDTDHWFFLLSRLQEDLEAYVAANKQHWRPNTINFTENWLREGLQDRAITRDLTWGIPIPEDVGGKEAESKRIYVWFEAVCGYLTAAIEWADRSARDDWKGILPGAHTPNGAPPAADTDAWQNWWLNPETKAYYFLGKDNIPFHTIIWPGILLAYNKARANRDEPALTLPFDVPANEFLNLGGEQFSKSRGVGIWVHDILDRFEADAVRYYLAVNMPEQRDADWTWDDFLAKVNDELVGTIGNLVHRVLSFTHKNLGEIPDAPGGSLAADVTAAIESCRDDMAGHLDAVRLKKAMRRLLEFAGWGNQFMQQVAPWKLLKQDEAAGRQALYELCRVVNALSIFMAPFLPSSSARIRSMLGQGAPEDTPWEDAGVLTPGPLERPQALFAKLEAKDIPQAKPADGAKNGSVVIKEEDMVDIDHFAKVQLRLAVVTSVEAHPKADKLYVLRLDAGDLGERQVVAGLKSHYEAEELLGKTVAFVANLKPAKLRGVESQGMILAADTGDAVSILMPHRPLPAGAKIR